MFVWSDKRSYFRLLAKFSREPGVTVETKTGAVRGSSLKSRKGKTIFSFRGVPYARPPVGPLRSDWSTLIGRGQSRLCSDWWRQHHDPTNQSTVLTDLDQWEWTSLSAPKVPTVRASGGLVRSAGWDERSQEVLKYFLQNIFFQIFSSKYFLQNIFFKIFSRCLQPNVLAPDFPLLEGGEDCLYLNIYTKHCPLPGRCSQTLGSHWSRFIKTVLWLVGSWSRMPESHSSRHP